MTTNELIQTISASFDKCLELIKRKNNDYAGKGDAFSNFRYANLVGVSVPRGILVRMTDKLARISNLLEKDPAIVEESIGDTLDDLTNYAQILKAYLGENK